MYWKDEVGPQLEQLLDGALPKIYIDPSKMSDVEQIGGSIAGLLPYVKDFGFDGDMIAEVLIYALYTGLEDCNWHTESAVFYKIHNQIKDGSLTLQDVVKILNDGLQVKEAGAQA